MCFWFQTVKIVKTDFLLFMGKWEGEFPSLVQSYSTRRLDKVFGGSWWLICLDVLGNVVSTWLMQSANFTKDFQAVLSQEPNSIWILKPCQLGEGRHIEILRFSGDTNNPQSKQAIVIQVWKQKKGHFVYLTCQDFHCYAET